MVPRPSPTPKAALVKRVILPQTRPFGKRETENVGD
jgi:hypothetical protein